MLFKSDTLDAIAAGKVTLAFRRWKRPTVAAGGRLRTRIGELAIDSVEKIAKARVSEAEARKAGCPSRAALLALLEKPEEGDIYRIAFHRAGADPRIALRARARLSREERTVLAEALARLDRASRSGPWTSTALSAVAAHPGRRAGDLAASLGTDTLGFKRNVRKLKELGLTESLEIGYRLSPRGRAFLNGSQP